jgi:hypothetical protein
MMKKADSARLETLEALIAEKRRQETFLAKLEERRAGTPEHVFNRLRDEYLTKLTDAQVKAAAEAESLSGGLEDDDAALADVEARLVALEEERIEVQLRAEVEEWEPKETQKKLTVMTAAISMAEKERDARKAVAERTRSLLAEARGDMPLPGPASSASARPDRPPMRPTTAMMTGGPNFDELAFLNSVVGRASTPPAPRESKPVSQADVPEIKESASARVAAVRSPTPTPTPSPTPTPAPAAPAPSAAPEASSAPAPLPVPPSPAPAPAPAPVAEPAPAPAPSATSSQPTLNLETPAPAAPAPAAAAPAAKPAPADDEDDEDSAPSPLGRPTPRTSQQIKTLKCAECGSMNYPTEWYCERCGGELAAL